MKEEYFVNIAIQKAIKQYLASINNKDSINFNSFLVVIIRILVLIYGYADIINPFYLKSSVAFFNNLGKYNMSESNIALFMEEILNYYNFECSNNSGNTKVKNPYFRSSLKYLVDMFVLKKRNVSVSFEEEEEFLELIYTKHTKNSYRENYNNLINDDPLYIEKYYYSKSNELEMTKDLGKTISAELNLEALKYVGVNLSNLADMSEEEILAAKKNAYDYFAVDAEASTREEDLEKSLNYYKLYGKKITSGNGYVDILLLMSVIVTSFSIIAIIIFSLM